VIGRVGVKAQEMSPALVLVIDLLHQVRVGEPVARRVGGARRPLLRGDDERVRRPAFEPVGDDLVLRAARDDEVETATPRPRGTRGVARAPTTVPGETVIAGGAPASVTTRR